MKLLRLKINEQFRSLPEGFEIQFNDPGHYKEFSVFSPYCFVGKNGSGKSNVLEAVAAIFYHIECCYLENRPLGFDKDEDNNEGFDPKKSMPDAYELEYVVLMDMQEDDEDFFTTYRHKFVDFDYVYISIIKEKNEFPEINIHNGLNSKDDRIRKVEGAKQVKKILPQRILAYSSGENEILSLPFLKLRFIQFDEYKYNSDREIFVKPETRMIYADNQYTQAILLSLLLMETDKHIFKPFRNTIQIEDIKEFRIIIRQNQMLEVDEELRTTIVNQNNELNQNRTSESRVNLIDDDYKRELTLGLEVSNSKSKVSLTGKSIVQKLKDCATSFTKDEFDTLYLDYWVNQDTKSAFQLHFESSFELFRTFQTLLNLNIYVVPKQLKEDLYQSKSIYVNETLPVAASDERIFRFKDFAVTKKGINKKLLVKELSDGEHQFLHSIGMCLLSRGENTLFLLDEPETHFNPDWRAQFISTLKECMEIPLTNKNKSEMVSHEMLITSHSPFIVSDCDKDYVYIFDRNKKTNELEYSKPDNQTFGASVNFLTNDIFNKKSTISVLGEKEIDRLMKAAEKANNEKLQKLRLEALALGDSVEKMFLMDFIDQRLKTIGKQSKLQNNSDKKVIKLDIKSRAAAMVITPPEKSMMIDRYIKSADKANKNKLLIMQKEVLLIKDKGLREFFTSYIEIKIGEIENDGKKGK